MVLSDKDGLGRRGSVRDLSGWSVWTSILPGTNISVACNRSAAGWTPPPLVLEEFVIVVSFDAGLSGRVRFWSACLLGSNCGGTKFTAARGTGSLENLGIPDAGRVLGCGGSIVTLILGRKEEEEE